MEAARKALVPLHPIGRLGQPEEIANGALFLASGESSFMRRRVPHQAGQHLDDAGGANAAELALSASILTTLLICKSAINFHLGQLAEQPHLIVIELRA